MALYKPYSHGQGEFIPIHFEKQILPGTFEYSLNHLIDHELEHSVFDNDYKNILPLNYARLRQEFFSSI